MRLRTRFVLSTRPGHGAEAKFKSDPVYSLRELTVADAERFICQRLDIRAGQHQHPALVAYRQAQPHINELFRRPLFLNAWCSECTENPNEPPNTLAKLMNVVLKKVFDDRVFRFKSRVPVGSADEIVLSRHVLGALLAAYGEQGFGQVCSLMQSEIEAALNDAECFVDSEEIARWHALAVRCGLLIPAGADHYTFKIPVVEYLIGSYYAWLVRPSKEASDDAKDKRRRQRFLRKFRQGFWWRQFDDIWLYAFDQLWRGSPRKWIWPMISLCGCSNTPNGAWTPGSIRVNCCRGRLMRIGFHLHVIGSLWVSCFPSGQCQRPSIKLLQPC